MPERELYKKLIGIKPGAVAVVGDLILDQYIYGDISRISPEAPVGVLDCTRDEFRLGGAANVASNLAKLGCKVSLVGVVGKDQPAKDFRRIAQKEKIDAKGLITAPDRPTIRKIRLMAQGQQLMRVDREKRHPISKEIEKRVLEQLKKNIKKFGAIILSDYDKGFLTDRLISSLISLARKNKKIVVIDPKGDSYAKYKGADIITPNKLELEKASGVKCRDKKSVEKAARLLIENHKLKAVLATLGPEGMAWFPAKGEGTFFPTVAREVFDVTGAGDTVVAVFTFAMMGGLSPTESARVSNHAGGIQVGHLGAVGVGLDEICEDIIGRAGITESKIVDLKTASLIASKLKKDKKKVVFTNGCFDLIHFGHIQYLQQAKKEGDWLVLGLNSDSSVKKLKGEGRPLINENDRAHILAALDCIDQVVLFSEPTPLKLIKAIKPNLLVKGGDYKESQIVGHKEVKKWGGRVATIAYKDGKSTTGIIEKIIGLKK